MARLMGGVPETLRARAAAAPHRLLMLDFDGTIAPFHLEREEGRRWTV